MLRSHMSSNYICKFLWIFVKDRDKFGELWLFEAFVQTSTMVAPTFFWEWNRVMSVYPKNRTHTVEVLNFENSIASKTSFSLMLMLWWICDEFVEFSMNLKLHKDLLTIHKTYFENFISLSWKISVIITVFCWLLLILFFCQMCLHMLCMFFMVIYK